MQRQVRLGFIGLGWIGRKRLDAVARHPLIGIAALVDAAEEKLRSASDAYPLAVAARNLDELLAAGVDGVVIATPNGVHAAQALRCLRAGVPVFCQKPLAITGSSALQVIEAAQEADKALAVDFCYRSVRGMDEAKRRIASGMLGEITAVDLKFHNAYGPDKQWCFDRAVAGGGCLLDLGVHLLALALWLQDFPPVEVRSSRRFARGRSARKEDIEDQAYVELRQRNGAIVRVACSWYAHIGGDAVIEASFSGTRGGLAWRNVGGSFYDFEMDACHGSRRETLARGADEWGPRALIAWVERIAQDDAFDPAALRIASSVQLIDSVYAS